MAKQAERLKREEEQVAAEKRAAAASLMAQVLIKVLAIIVQLFKTIPALIPCDQIKPFHLHLGSVVTCGCQRGSRGQQRPFKSVTLHKRIAGCQEQRADAGAEESRGSRALGRRRPHCRIPHGKSGAGTGYVLPSHAGCRTQQFRSMNLGTSSFCQTGTPCIRSSMEICLRLANMQRQDHCQTGEETNCLTSS